jgi:hypothetical protein
MARDTILKTANLRKQYVTVLLVMETGENH